jgi:hypothetical protein
MGGSGAIPWDGRKKKKGRGYEKLQYTALVVAATTGGRGDRNKRSRTQRVTAARALYIPKVATASRSVARLLISQNASANAPASDVSSLLETAPHLAAVLAKKRSTTARWLRLNRTLGISHPKGT